MTCPCGSGSSLLACCGRFHRGENPPTAEGLMRARYSAYAVGEIDFLVATGTDADRAGIAAWSQRAKFLRLRVEATESGGAGDDLGFVTFSATFLESDRFSELRERSRFERIGGRWRYIGGDSKVTTLSPGRNDACPCGSGEKLKRCHAR